MTRLRRRAGAAAALAAAVLVAAPAAPAGAAPTITINTPTDRAVLDSATVAVKGRAVVTDLLLTTFKEVTLTVGGMTLRVPCTESPCNFTWSPSLATNGQYDLVVSATEQTVGIEGARKTETRTFVVDAPPAKPVLEAPKITEARTVDLSWTRNTEPDMLYYAVFRKDPAGATFSQVGRVNQPTTGRTVAFTDATTTLSGGAYAYQVVAVRKGGAKPETISAPSAAAAATVPAPPTTLAAPGPGAAAGGTTTTAKPGSAAGVDLSSFLASRARVAPAPPPTVIEPRDTGYQGILPSGAAPPGEDLEEGEAEAVPPSTRRSTSAISLKNGRPLVPVAGGFILLLLAMHARVLNRRLMPAAGGDLPLATALPVAAARHPGPVPRVPEPDVAEMPDGPELNAAEPEAPAAEAELEDGPAPAFYDAADDPGWHSERDSEWAPAAERSAEVPPEQEPEPEPEPHAEKAEFDLEPKFRPVAEPETAAPDPAPGLDLGEIEVIEVIAPTRRPLARSGSR